MTPPPLRALLLLAAASPLGATEPPGAWFLNAHHTGSDPYVYFSVGGVGETPPLGPDEVVLGWSWDEAGTPTGPYPGRLPVRYRTAAVEEKRPRQWREKSSRVGHPPIAVGPGNELIFLGDDARTTTNALRWAELLDVVEAAWRHSSPDLTAAERRGELAVGLLGGCPVRSRPVDGDARGWAPLALPGHARPSRAGGFYYVDDARAPAEPTGTVVVRRFLRRVDSAEGCSGDELDLRLFPAPRGEALAYAYFLIWKDADVLSAGFLDLEPEPMKPAVRRIAGRTRERRSERANVGRWPRDRDLCRDPLVGELCRRDAAIRRKLATSLGPRGLPAALDRCRRLLRSLAAPGRDPCSDREAWSSESGLYLMGYRGELPLVEDRLESRMVGEGSVEWVWLDRAARDRVEFGLADGTRISLRLPPEVPPPPATPLSSLPSDERAPERESKPPWAAASTREMPSDSSDSSDSSDISDISDSSDAEHEPPPPATAADRAPPLRVSHAADHAGSFQGVPAMRWPDPRLLIAAPAVLFVFLAVRLLRRAASRPRSRTSYVLRVRAPSPLPTAEVAEAALGDLPLVLPERASAPDLVPAVDSWDVVKVEAPPPPAAESARDELNAFEAAERAELLGALAAARRLAEWVACVLPVFREIEEARGGTRFESLPLPARREWIDAYDTLRRFAESSPRQPLSSEDDLGLDLSDPELPLKERLRRHLLGGDGSGIVQGVVLALQYLLEAFPVEQMDRDQRRDYKAALRARLPQDGNPPRLHELVGELAAGLGLVYRPVRYYRSEIGQTGFEFLDDAHDPLSLAARVGYEAATEGPTVVRLTELFLVDTSTRAPFSGRAAVDRSAALTPGRF